jgi:hypothetical protein
MGKTVILGNEYDDDLKSRLIDKLKEMGANPVSSDWGVAGSQEVESLSVRLRDQIVEIESETFVGLSIFGPEELVDEIASLLKLC